MEGYFNASGTSQYVTRNSAYRLYKDGVALFGDTNKTYTPIAFYDDNGDVISFDMTKVRIFIVTDGSGDTLRLSQETYNQPLVKYVTYKEE